MKQEPAIIQSADIMWGPAKPNEPASIYFTIRFHNNAECHIKLADILDPTFANFLSRKCWDAHNDYLRNAFLNDNAPNISPKPYLLSGNGAAIYTAVYLIEKNPSELFPDDVKIAKTLTKEETLQALIQHFADEAKRKQE